MICQRAAKLLDCWPINRGCPLCLDRDANWRYTTNVKYRRSVDALIAAILRDLNVTVTKSDEDAPNEKFESARIHLLNCLAKLGFHTFVSLGNSVAQFLQRTVSVGLCLGALRYCLKTPD